MIVTSTQTETTLGSDRHVDSNIHNFVEITHEETSDGQVESSTQALPEESSEQATTVSIQTPIHSMTTRSKVGISKPSSKYNSLECALLSFNIPIEPKRIKNALKHLGWAQAMQEEIFALHHNKTWSLVP